MKKLFKDPDAMLAMLVYFIIQPVLFVVGMGLFVNAIVQTIFK